MTNITDNDREILAAILRALELANSAENQLHAVQQRGYTFGPLYDALIAAMTTVWPNELDTDDKARKALDAFGWSFEVNDLVAAVESTFEVELQWQAPSGLAGVRVAQHNGTEFVLRSGARLRWDLYISGVLVDEFDWEDDAVDAANAAARIQA